MAASTPISVYDRYLNTTDKLAAYCCTIAVELNAITLLMFFLIYIPINTTEICCKEYTKHRYTGCASLLCDDFNAHNTA